MGMFDTVWLNCPNCGSHDEIQTKSGACLLNNFSLHEAPMDVLSGVLGTEHCPSCGKPYVIELIHRPIAVARKLTAQELEQL